MDEWTDDILTWIQSSRLVAPEITCPYPKIPTNGCFFFFSFFSFFFGHFCSCDVAKVAYNLQEDLARFGYNLAKSSYGLNKLKFKVLSYFWLLLEPCDFPYILVKFWLLKFLKRT
jgi:hypothetical protein